METIHATALQVYIMTVCH